MSRASRYLVLAAVCSAVPGTVLAQARQPRFEISAGALYLSGQSLAEQDATLTRNQREGERFTVFESDSRIESAPGLEARIAYYVTRNVALEGGALWSRPRLTARLASDVEGIPDVTVEEDLSHYVFDGAIAVHFPGSRRATPFIRGGVGYVRQLHEENVLVEQGLAYHAGGGATFWFGTRRTTGLRVDARLVVLDGAIDLGRGTRTIGAGGAAFVVKF